jgi:cytochrome P450
VTCANLTDPKVLANPYSLYKELRHEAPAVQVDPDGMWAVTRFEDVVDVLKRVDDFSSQAPKGAREKLFENAFGGQNIIGVDNPDHDRLRSIMQKRFTPRRLTHLQDRVEELSRELLRDAITQGDCDLVSAFTVPLPVVVIAELLGVEANRVDDFKRWSNALIAIVNAAEGDERQVALGEVKELANYLAAMADKRRQQPAEDLISALVAAEQEPGRISAGEVLSYCVLLLAAGNETTTNLIGGMISCLIENPDQLALLRNDPSLIPDAVEEGLRYCSPVQGLFRYVTRDTDLNGVTIPAGSRVWVCYASANRDPKRFEDPDRFDITRDARGHVAFGWGLHFCLGSNLARREARVAIAELVPFLSQAEFCQDVEWLPSWVIRGPKSLLIRKAA